MTAPVPFRRLLQTVAPAVRPVCVPLHGSAALQLHQSVTPGCRGVWPHLFATCVARHHPASILSCRSPVFTCTTCSRSSHRLQNRGRTFFFACDRAPSVAPPVATSHTDLLRLRPRIPVHAPRTIARLAAWRFRVVGWASFPLSLFRLLSLASLGVNLSARALGFLSLLGLPLRHSSPSPRRFACSVLLPAPRFSVFRVHHLSFPLLPLLSCPPPRRLLGVCCQLALPSSSLSPLAAAVTPRFDV